MRFRKTLAATFALVLAASAYAQTVPGQNPATKSGGPPALQLNTPPTPLFLGNGVGQAIGVNQQQMGRLQALTNQTQNTFRDRYNNLNTLNETERAAQWQALNQQYNTALMNGARDIFNKDQLRRHEQLQLQYNGFGSLENPDVQRQLNLTDQQRQNLRQGVDWRRKQMQDISQLAPTDAARAEQLYRNYRREHQERFNQFLTPDQQKQWQQMTGESFNFAPPFMVTVPPRR